MQTDRGFVRASDRRQLGAHAPGVRAHPRHDLTRHPRRDGARRRPGDGAGRARLRRLGAPGSSRTRSCRTRGSPCRPTSASCSTRPTSSAGARPDDCSASTSPPSAPTWDMPDGGRTRHLASPQLILAFDFGTRRIGVAAGDTLRARPADWRRSIAPAACRGPRSTRSARTAARPQLIVGLPLNMDGTPTALTAAARAVRGASSRRAIAQPVALVDERLSSPRGRGRAARARARPACKRGRTARCRRRHDRGADPAGTLVRGRGRSFYNARAMTRDHPSIGQ